MKLMGKGIEIDISTAQIFLVGPFPPPVHGMALVNAMIRDHIIRIGVNPIILNTSPKTLDRRLSIRLMRLSKVLLGLVRILFCIRNSKFPIIYISVSGGYGQLYDILFIMLGRLSRSKIYLHHHSYAYLTRLKRIAQLLTLIAGKNAFHITLCNEMSEQLKCRYNHAERIIVLSN